MDPLSPLAEQAARTFKARAEQVGGDRILEFRVFGSMARGEAHAGSDLDIFVMVDQRDPNLDQAIIEAACSVEEEFGFPFLVAPRIMAQAHFEELVRRERLLARDILNEGIPL
ncbi:MAG: nucleotidyltransferase domain-containing protein [Candidatus Eremiobacteraeota bacterium]|nr:nucleotidyltransferase domain-containing protein [Candidatus Eremiobacteraeota bacterium]